MGTIVHTSSKKTVVLAAHSVVGRAPTHVVRLDTPAVSTDHASITWNGECWEARDLGSTNGTWVDGKRLPLKERVALARGSRLWFGEATEQWELSDDRGPVVIALCLTTGDTRAAENGLLDLPDETDVRVSIVREDEQWFVETLDGSRHRAINEESIPIGDQLWKLVVPPESPSVGTYKAKPLTLEALTLRFHVSQDEQHISLDLIHGDEMIVLGDRALFGVLLSLARKRLADEVEARLPESERGWYAMADLMYEHNVDEVFVNRQISRLRELFQEKGVEDGANIVEKRTKQRRIGTSRLQVS